MSDPLTLLRDPCSTCPYRLDAPAGIWDASEYAKLPAWDDPMNLSAGTLLCHSVKGAICRGWRETHHESLAVRMAVSRAQCDPGNYEPSKVACHASGRAAMLAGLRGVKRPGKKAKTAISKIIKRRKNSP